MSTDLYGIRILEVSPDERRMRLRAFVVYYDTAYEYHQPIPSDRSFFVRVLCDREALGDDIADADRFDEDYVDQNAFRYVERFEELERRNVPVESYDGFADFYYERDGGWQDEEKLAQADYDVWVAKAEYLEPFSVGDSWGTTSYPTNADELTADEYLDVPDFGDSRTLIPFPEAQMEASTVRRLAFSADGEHLLVSHDDGGFRVFSTDDWSTTFEVESAGGWLFEPGWTHDGRVAGWTGDGFTAYDPETGGSESFEPFGWSSNATGTRFVTGPDDEKLRIKDQHGEVLFEHERPPDLMAWAAFDASGDRCALAVEMEPLRIVDLSTGDVSALSEERFNSVALSPDGEFVLASTFQGLSVRRSATGAVLRSRTVRQKYPTAVSWSPGGKIVAAAVADGQGYNSRISIHRIGREVDAAANAPVEPPPRESKNIGDLAKHYVERTAEFSAGWDTHIDDDLLDFHLTLVRADHSVDLVPYMREEQTAIAARAYEAAALSRAGEGERAVAALEDALTRLGAFEVPDWSHTFVYAPLAAAQFLGGDVVAAEESLGLARTELESESNPFQKRAVLARALLQMGRTDEVARLIDAEDGGWVSQFHERLLDDLVLAAELDLLRAAFDRWDVADEWDVPGQIQKRLLETGDFRRAVSLRWLGEVDAATTTAVSAWLQWFDEDPEQAETAFAEASTSDPEDLAIVAVRCHREPRRANRHAELGEDYRARPEHLAALLRSPYENMSSTAWEELDHDGRFAAMRRLLALGALGEVSRLDTLARDPEDRVAFHGLRGDWAEAYAVLDQTKRTLRNPLYSRAAGAAAIRGDVDILIDVLSNLPCSDMNSPGLRAAQRAFADLGGLHYRRLHP